MRPRAAAAALAFVLASSLGCGRDTPMGPGAAAPPERQATPNPTAPAPPKPEEPVRQSGDHDGAPVAIGDAPAAPAPQAVPDAPPAERR